jgi:DNA polymerase
MTRTLQELGQFMSTCTDCELSVARRTVVFGVGDPTADLLFIGEGPGSNEDQQGIPFVGPAGQLLNTLLSQVGISRESVYICNVVLCRPPGNRDPLPEEIEACKPRLLEQVGLVDPLVVVTLGNFATRTILNRMVGITRVRGQRFTWEGRTVIPTYHPAAILRGGRGRIMEEAQADFRTITAAVEEARAAATLEAIPGPLVEEQLGLF